VEEGVCWKVACSFMGVISFKSTALRSIEEVFRRPRPASAMTKHDSNEMNLKDPSCNTGHGVEHCIESLGGKPAGVVKAKNTYSVCGEPAAMSSSSTGLDLR